MTDEQKLETEEQEDVEGHGALSDPALEPALEPKHADDDDDVVEGHAALGPLGKQDEPAL